MEKFKKILVVDDDEECREFLSDILRERGYRVDCAKNGNEALEYISSNQYFLIITDHNMPELKGLDLTVIIREREPELPIIGISGEEMEGEFMEKGASFFMKKPLDIKKLIEIVEKFK